MANTHYTILLECKNNYAITLQYNIVDNKHIDATSETITAEEYNGWDGLWFVMGVSY